MNENNLEPNMNTITEENMTVNGQLSNYEEYLKSLEPLEKETDFEKEDILTAGFVIKSIIAFILYSSIFFVEFTATNIWMPIIGIVYRTLPFHNIFQQLSGGDEAILQIYQSMFINNFIYIALFVIIVPMFWKEIRLGIKKISKELWRISTLPVIYIITIFSSAAVVAIAKIFVEIPDTSLNQESINASMAVSPWGNVFSTIIGAPFVEEIVFRVIIGGGVFMLLTTLFNKKDYSKNKKRIFTIIAITISTVFFAWIHVSSGDYLAVFPYLVMGLSMTMTYFLSDRNVIMSILLHMLTNIIAFFANM